MTLLYTLGLPLLIIVAGMLAAAAIAFFAISWLHRSQPRHTPLTHDLLRPPGHSLQQRINEDADSIAAYLGALIALPPLCYALHISQSYLGGEPESLSRTLNSIGVALIPTTVVCFFLVRVLKESQYRRVGVDAERFTGQELNLLMRDGSFVFHDIQYPYGNIDHVVVNQGGVWAINTKAYGKLKTGSGAEVTVDNSTNAIRFPDRTVPIPLKQLGTEARWLSEMLSSATGEAVRVQSMLAIPGWYIKDRNGRSDVYVFNPLNCRSLFTKPSKQLSPEQVQRISHQLEQLCRDIAPSMARPKEWK